MTPIVLRYPEDMTGTSPNNLVLNELHQTPNTRIRAIAPLHGPFYSQSVVLKDALTDVPLIKGQDYFCVEYYEIPSLKSGKEVCAIVLITNEEITANQFKLEYQVVGGEFSYSYDAIVELVNKVMDDTRPVSWPNIINIPPQFQPAPHRHDIGDTFGWEYIVSQLESVRKAILLGDSASHDEIYRYIDFRINNDILPLLNQTNDELQAHIADTDNPHQTTAAQVGAYSIAQIDAILSGQYLPLSGSTQMTGTLTGVTTSMSMTQDAGATRGSLVTRATGTGDANLAGMSFYNNAYGIKMGVRADGVWGIGGWSRAPWSLYSDASGNLVAAGDVRAYSDPRLKEDITFIDNALERFSQLQGVRFRWKDVEHVANKAGTYDFGVLADQVQAVFPEAVGESISIGGESYKVVAYQKLVAPLIVAVNELNQEIESVRDELRALKDQVNVSQMKFG